MSREVLGVDIGGVVIDRVNDNTDTSFFGNNYLKTTAVPDVFAVLQRLATGRFAGNLHLVRHRKGFGQKGEHQHRAQGVARHTSLTRP